MKKINIDGKLIEKANKLSNECIGCKKCMKNCTMLNEFCKSPKELLKGIAEEGKIEAIIPYSCTLCDSCTSVCPKNINLKEFFFDLRKHIIENDNKDVKALGHNIVKSHQKNSFSRIFTASSKNNKNIRKVFIPGCSLTAYSPNIVMKAYEYLRENLQDIGIILKCCGNPTHCMGEENVFKNYYSQLQKEIDKMNVDEVIVACENCFKTIKENSSNLRVKSLWEIIGDIGVPTDMCGKYKNIDLTFAIHDPCPIRNETKIHDSIRKIAAELGVKTEEFKYCRENTLCCGAGGMVGVTNNKLAVNQMKKRAVQTNAEYILTYCQACAESMTAGGKQGVHILDLIFNEEMYSSLNFKQVQKNTIYKWVNRYKAKRIIKKYN